MKMNLDSVCLFRAKNKTLAAKAVEILAAERPMTLRQLFYRLISAGAMANSQPQYKRIGCIMTRLREANHVPLDWIVDHVRATLKPSSWTGLGDFGETIRTAYRKDFWAKMLVHVELFVEKDAIAGTIQPVTEEYDIRLHVCRGYSSVSFAGHIAELWKYIPKPIHCYYVGDFDPSGFDIERDLREKLARYSGRREKPPATCSGNRFFSWTRLAVRLDDFAAHDLIRLPVKDKDNRSAGFRRTWGNDCAEVDALAPSELRRRVGDAVKAHIELKEWERLLEIETLEKKCLDNWVEGMNTG